MYEWDMKSLNAYANIDLTRYRGFDEIANHLMKEKQLDKYSLDKVMINIWKPKTVVLGSIDVNWFLEWWTWEPISIDDIIESVHDNDDFLLLITNHKIFLVDEDIMYVRRKVYECMKKLSTLIEN